MENLVCANVILLNTCSYSINNNYNTEAFLVRIFLGDIVVVRFIITCIINVIYVLTIALQWLIFLYRMVVWLSEKLQIFSFVFMLKKVLD